MVWHELRATQPVVALETISFAAGDGVKNLLTAAMPEQTAATLNTIVLCLPAMGVAAKNYKQLLKLLAAGGVRAACYDLRGNGNSSVRASRNTDFGYQALVELDLPAAIDALVERYPQHELVLFGHSLGGQVASLYLGQHEHNVKALILSASCSVYYRNWPRPHRWGLLLSAQMAWLVSSLVGYFPGRKIGFGGKEARSVMRDWALNARTGDYLLANSDKSYREFTPLNDTPVLAINFANDHNFAPPKATEHLLSKLNSNAVTRKTISAEQLGLDQAGHLNWLKRPEAVANTVRAWLTTQNGTINS